MQDSSIGEQSLADEKLTETRAKLESWYDLSIKVHRDERQDARKSLDQNLLALSSGALALTLAFINNVHGHVAHWRWLETSWICFILTIVFTLFSYLLSELASSKKVDDVDKTYIETLKNYKFDHEVVDSSKSWAWTRTVRDLMLKQFPSDLIDVLNTISLSCFIIGLVILSSVCWCNFAMAQASESNRSPVGQKEKIMAKEQEKRIVESAPVKKPPGELQQEGLKPSTTKPIPIPTKPQPKPQPTTKPSNQK